MRSRILGGVGALWGGAITARALLAGSGLDFSSSYAAGQSTALVFGVALFLVGSYYLVKRRSA